MTSISRISIVGCGWLGTPLAQALLKQAYKVKGSRRELAQLAELELLGIEPYQLELSPFIECNDIDGLLDSDLIIINIPPRRKVNSCDYHVSQINSLLDAVKASGLNKVLFISSTSVYGNKNQELNEDEQPSPETESGRALVLIEQVLLRDTDYQASTLRFAGLVGGERKPGRFLSGKHLSGGNSPVNLLHRDDCIGIISALIKRDIWGEVFNVCADQHPSRQQLYSKAAVALGLPEPSFDLEPDNWKIINNAKIKATLNYQFIYPDPMDFVS